MPETMNLEDNLDGPEESQECSITKGMGVSMGLLPQEGPDISKSSVRCICLQFGVTESLLC